MSDDWDWYPRSKPRKVRGGLLPKSQRGAFSASWWGKRWIAVLERFGWANRLQRGRSYARSGQVRKLVIKPGHAEASVQGSRAQPYWVAINLQQLTDEQWEAAIDAMASQALFAAKLLAGEMPPNIEEAFEAAGVPLFPRSGRDLDTLCSCPDLANPCKHIAATYYLMGDRFDEDPFMLFVLRGRTREQVMEGLRRRRAAAAAQTPEPEATPADVPAAPPLDADLENFYVAGPGLDDIHAHIARPAVPGAALKPLGPAPAGASAELLRLVEAVSEAVVERVVGE